MSSIHMLGAAPSSEPTPPTTTASGGERFTYMQKIKSPSDMRLNTDDDMQSRHSKGGGGGGGASYRKPPPAPNYHSRDYPLERSNSQVSMTSAATSGANTVQTFDSAGLDLLGDVSLGELTNGLSERMETSSVLSTMSSIVSENTTAKQWLPPTRGWSLPSQDDSRISRSTSRTNGDASGTDALSPPVRRKEEDDDYYKEATNLRPTLVRHDESSKSFTARNEIASNNNNSKSTLFSDNSNAGASLLRGLSQSSVATFSLSGTTVSGCDQTMASIDTHNTNNKPSFLIPGKPVPVFCQDAAEREAIVRLSNMHHHHHTPSLAMSLDDSSRVVPQPAVVDTGKRKALDITTSNEDLRAQMLKLTEQQLLKEEQQKRARNAALAHSGYKPIAGGYSPAVFTSTANLGVATLSLAQLDLTAAANHNNSYSAKPAVKPRVVKQPERLQFYEKTEKDVIFGRGNGPNAHNAFFREQVLLHRQAYFDGHNAEKLAVVDRLFEWVGVNGGRFLDKDKATARWYQVTNRAAFTKIRQMIRENKTAQERQQKNTAATAGGGAEGAGAGVKQ